MYLLSLAIFSTHECPTEKFHFIEQLNRNNKTIALIFNGIEL